MTTVDPSTGRPLPSDAIQRVLYIGTKAHVYQIPPLTSTRGFNAASWTAGPSPTARQIFTARIRLMETSYEQTIKTDILLEDPKTGDLFAAAPYTTSAVVQQALDSSRFFAIRVVGDGGMKATLGIAFEERSDAFDFSIALGDARKVIGIDEGGAQNVGMQGSKKAVEEPKKDFSLKEGETIHVNIGGRGRRNQGITASHSTAGADDKAFFSIKPPPSAGGSAMPALAPPPSAADVRSKGSPSPSRTQAQELGFDDGEFGEFQ